MCGIFGHVGSLKSIEKCLKGLKFLEYRGYDSAGIAGILEDGLFCIKEQGKLCALENALSNPPKNCKTAIGHTRWATHGRPSTSNAHPHMDQKHSLAIVHNGILENHNELRTSLIDQGVTFASDTDSEVIAQLISIHYEGDILQAVQKSLPLMKGFWALAVVHKDHPDQIIATRLESPLVIGQDVQASECFLSSDVYAFQRQDLDLIYLKNHEIAVISHQSIKIFDEESRSVDVIPQKIDLPDFEISKGDYSHFMLKEIFEQPAALQSSIHNRLPDFPSELKEFSNILLLGCGTSWHAGCIAALQFEEKAGLTARAEIASEFRYKKAILPPNTLVIALSQSGETFDTIAATSLAKKQGAKVLTICNVPESTLVREADYYIPLRAGPEISVCSTKAFNCQLAVLSLLADAKNLQDILALPKIVEQVLEQEETLIHLAQKYAGLSSFFFIGRQYMYPTCMESALKLKEISYQSAFAYPAGELKHGPIALIDPNCLVIGLCGNNATYEKMLSNLMEVKARSGKILAIAPEGAKEIAEIADDVIWLPPTPDSLSPVPYSVCTQLLAYYIAKERGTDIDQPRNLAKSVTVE
ncbi:MAG: glutamine--fructose-6-phosphate transaminase (isomerizing) [Simkaniaceae bacterium]|nr:glutamine--fructose-6-phosphate transaminase (isomerizing) [Candidatus Sacchlamyda saccharinae]